MQSFLLHARRASCGFKRTSESIVRGVLRDGEKFLRENDMTLPITGGFPACVIPVVVLWNDYVEYIIYPWARLLRDDRNPLYLGLTIIWWASVFAFWIAIIQGPIALWVLAIGNWIGWVLILSNLAVRAEEFGTFYGALLSYIPDVAEWFQKRWPEEDTVFELIRERCWQADLTYLMSRLYILTLSWTSFSREEVKQVLAGSNENVVSFLTGTLEDVRARIVPHIFPPPTARANAFQELRLLGTFPRKLIGPLSVPTPAHPHVSSSVVRNGKRNKQEKKIHTETCPISNTREVKSQSSSSSRTLSNVSRGCKMQNNIAARQKNDRNIDLDAYGRPKLLPIISTIFRARTMDWLRTVSLLSTIRRTLRSMDVIATAFLGCAFLSKRSRKRIHRFLAALLITFVKRKMLGWR